MEEAKLFTNGQSQAVRLPKQFRFKGKSVFIRRVGDLILLIPKKKPWKSLADACGKFSDDFMPSRDQGQQERNDFFA